MVLYTRYELDTLETYQVALQKIAHDFYDERYQPKPEIKAQIEQAHRGFWDTDFAIGLTDTKIMGRQDVIRDVVSCAGYPSVMQYNTGGKGLTYVAKDDHDDWTILRGWTRRLGYRDGERDNNPIVLQPERVLSVGEMVPPVEILPFVPIINIFGYNMDLASDEICDAAPALEKFFRQAGLSYEILNDLGVLPNGQLVFADPGHAHMSNSESGLARIADATEQYRDAAKEHTAISGLFDYILPDKRWAQDAFFKRVQPE